MKQRFTVILVPLVLALAVPYAGAASGSKNAVRKTRQKTAGLRATNGTQAIMGLAPINVLNTPGSLSADEQHFVRLVNEERAQQGLSQLVVDPVLVAAARQHSREMAELKYFDHYSPVRGMRTPLERYGVALGTRRFTCTVGENLFYCSRRDVELGHRSLMKSPGHRANIMARDYDYIGVGVYVAPNGEYYVTQMFHT